MEKFPINNLTKELCFLAEKKMRSSEDPLHNQNHVERLLKSLEDLAKSEKIPLNYDIIVPAICFHDIWVGSKTTTNNIFIWIYKYIFDGPFSALIFLKVSFINNLLSKNTPKIFYAIFTHSLEGPFYFLRGLFLESAILSDVDNIDEWSGERIFPLEKNIKTINKNALKFGYWYYKKVLSKKLSTRCHLRWSKVKYEKDRLIFCTKIEKLIKKYIYLLS